MPSSGYLVISVLITLAVSLVVSACTTDEGDASLVLDAMVPSANHLSPPLSGFLVDSEASGYSNLDQYVSAFFDPETDRAELVDFGFQMAYTRYFVPTVDADTAPSGAITEVVLFNDAAGASNGLENFYADAVENTGADNGRWAVIDVTPFGVDGVDAADAYGAVIALGRSGSSEAGVYGTTIWFSHGKFTGRVAIGSLEPLDYIEDALALANLLRRRMGIVTQS